MHTMLSLEDLTLQYGPVAALTSVSLSVERGEIACLLGPSGSGKSSLLRLIAGVEHPSAGRVVIDGVEVAGPQTFVEPERRRVGMVFQDYALFPHLTVEANVAFGLRGSAARQRGTRGRRHAGSCRSAALRGQLSTHAVGRRAPARRPRAGPGAESTRAADGRAVLQPRWPPARSRPRADDGVAPRHADDDDYRDARPSRGRADRRSNCVAESGTPRPARFARGALHSSGHAICRRLLQRHQRAAAGSAETAGSRRRSEVLPRPTSPRTRRAASASGRSICASLVARPVFALGFSRSEFLGEPITSSCLFLVSRRP